MVTDSAALIMFAIRSSVKLAQQARLSYVDSTRRRKLVLPLPNFDTETDELAAVGFFKHGVGKKFVKGYEADGQIVAGDQELKAAIDQFNQNQPDLKLNRQLMDFHTKYRYILRLESDGTNGDSDLSPDAVLALLSVQQWRRGYDPTPSTLHRLGGTLVEIGIDYALESPDLFDTRTAKGKALKGFFAGLDEIDFKESQLSELPMRLFVASIEVIGETPELVAGDAKAQELIKVTTTGISANVKTRLEKINRSNMDAVKKQKARLNVQDWADLVFRSTLSTGGRLVLDHPGKFLGVKTDEHQALVSSVGGSVLDIVLDDDAGLSDVLSRQGLETILKASLSVVGDHPQILTRTKHQGVKKLVSGLAKDLSKTEGLLSKDILPELLRMSLEKTGQNLELFWPDLKNHPENNLLLTAGKTTLKILSDPPGAGTKWKLEFSGKDLLSVTESVLDEFLKNPQWLLDEAGEIDGTLEDVLSATIGVLRKRGDKRLSASVAIEIINSSIKAVVLRQEFVEELPNGQPIVTAAIDTVMAAIFKKSNDPQVSWQLLRAEVITGATEVSLNALAKTDLQPGVIKKLKKAVKLQVASLKEGKLFDLDEFSVSVTTALSPEPTPEPA